MWPTVTLAEARAKRDEAKKALAEGIDPKDIQKGAQLEAVGAFTFETIAREWHDKQKNWSDDHRARVLRYLELYIFPHIGNLDIRKLKTSQLLAPITAVDKAGKNDVAKRLQQRVTAIMRYAVQKDIIDSNPANDMAGALSTTKKTVSSLISSSSALIHGTPHIYGLNYRALGWMLSRSRKPICVLAR